MLSQHFQDMPIKNQITIAFSRNAKRRLGSIRLSPDKKESRILINGIFRNEAIPEQIICSTIAHELCHYAHGFCSPLERKYTHPHAGRVIERELKKRGLHLLYEYEKQWLKNRWPKILEEYGLVRRHRLSRFSAGASSLRVARHRPMLTRLRLLLYPE